MVGAGSEPQPRDIASDPQHRRLSRRDWRRSLDADSRPRRDHADPSHRGLGLAHGDPSRIRPRGAADRLLDPLHRDIGGFCKLLAAWRGVAVADRTWRRRRRRAGSRPSEDELTTVEDHDAPFTEEDDGGSVSLGWAFHAAMSARARLWRMLALAYSSLVASAPPPRSFSYERQEPSLGGRVSPDTPVDEDFDEDEEDEIPAARAPRRKPAARAPSRRSSERFDLPPISVLSLPKASDRQPLSRSELDSNSRALEGVLGDFGVRGEIVKAHPGPVVTLYELEPAPGIKSSRVIGLADDIARSMSALSARVAVVP